ncbi:hypothetical protein VTN02DRAFT_5532 [Thermoascus thermophilus]
MARSGATIDDYFRPEGSGRKHKRIDLADEIRDGFSVDDPSSSWKPRQNYEDVLIGELTPGPRRVTFMARVVNIYDLPVASKSPRAAKGCLQVLAKDHTGCILIRLWYIDLEYNLGLGSLFTVWTPHVSVPKPNPRSGGPNRGRGDPAPLMTSIFPERDGACRVVVHDDGVASRICRVPLGYREGQPPGHGLSSLAESRRLAGREASVETTVLVYVKAVGAVTRVTNSKGQPADKIDIGIGDESGEAILTLYGRMMLSALRWTPGSTILLISRVHWRLDWRLSVTARTMIDVDPDIVEAEWLRRAAVGRSRCVNQAYPEGVFDVETLESAPVKLKFTLADIDEFVRARPNEIYMGYMSLLITEVNLTTLYTKRRLFSAECCNMPLFANAVSADCGQCGRNVELRLNPQVIGALTDETGTISCSPPPPFRGPSALSNPPSRLSSTPLVWSPHAWRQLLGREPAELLTAAPAHLGSIQSRLRFLRITVVFGWSGEVGKLAICRTVG